MKYNQLGRTGLFVSEICLGTMTFGGSESAGMWKAIGALQQDEVDAIVGRALEAGVNFFDTADVYSFGESEKLLGQAFKNHIDLYQIHGNDSVTPIDETLRALDDLIRQGLVRYVGVSNWAAWKIAKALGISEARGYARFETLQAYYSIAGRDLERDLVPLISEEKLGLMVWSPLAGGLLSGKFGPGSNNPENARRTSFDFPPVNKDRAWACVEVMREVGQAHDASVARVALAYILQKAFTMSIIIGAKTLEQLDDNLAAAALTLTDDEMKRLDGVSDLPSEYPGWMFARQGGNRRPKPFLKTPG